jgi:hypothetical protein
MPPDERWEWDWKALPNWAKVYTFLLGVPSFSILVWDVFAGPLSERVKIICVVAFLSVALVQIFCLNRIIRKGDR